MATRTVSYVLACSVIVALGVAPEKTLADGPADAAVLQVVVNKVVEPLAAKLDRLDGRSKATLIKLAPTTLTLCGTDSSGRCISAHVLKIVRRAASNGDYYREFGDLIAGVKPSSVPMLRSRLLIDARSLSRTTEVQPFDLVFASPIYFRTKALVYFQFGHGYNGGGWLVILNQSSSGWVVEGQHQISSSN